VNKVRYNTIRLDKLSYAQIQTFYNLCSYVQGTTLHYKEINTSKTNPNAVAMQYQGVKCPYG